MAVESSILNFFEHLPKLISILEIETNLRCTKTGVFVQEAFVDPLILAYQKWLSQVTESEKSLEKCERKLFGEQEQKLWYVIEGNKCLSGYLLPLEISEPQKLKIPLYRGNFLDPLKCIHQKDAYLSKLEKVVVKIHPHQGLTFEIIGSSRKLEFNESFVFEFAEVIRASRWFSRDYPNVRRALRYALNPLGKFLEKLQEIPLREDLLIPENLRQKQNLQYYRAKGIIFVLEGNKLSSCYCLKGRSLGKFIEREIRIFSAGENAKRINRFDPTNPKKGCLGKIWSRGMSLHLHRRAFDLFLRQVSRSRNLKEKLSSRFSIPQLVERFVGIFINAQYVEEREILAYISRQRMQLAKYRKVGRWLFMIVDKNIIYSCLAIRENPKKINS